MTFTKSKASQVLIWLLPSLSETTLYLFVTFVTFLIANVVVIQNWLLVPADFSLRVGVLQAISNLLEKFLGERIAAFVPVAIFWGIIGMLFYIFVWLLTNFSIELSNDLAITKFVHPKGTDAKRPLENFVSQLIFRLVIGVFLIFYLTIVSQAFLPVWLTNFSQMTTNWPQYQYLKVAVLSLLAEMLALHAFTVIIRLFLLRKRIFG